MSRNGGNPDIVTVPCQHCKATLELLKPSNVIVMNSLRASTVIVPHAEPVICPGCRSVYQITIEPLTEIQFNLRCYQKAENKIVLPPGAGIVM
jgi:hypothetical protein